MTVARIAHTLHEYAHATDAASYGEEAAMLLGVDPARVFKTLLAAPDAGRPVVGVVPVVGRLDVKALAAAAGHKQLAMADPAVAERMTGYVVGGISPIGLKQRLALFVDESARQWPTIFVSGGRRGLEIELAPDDLCARTGATYAAIAG